MAEAPGELERRIADTRAELGAKLDRLEARTRNALSVRRRVAERPWMAVGAAAAVGFAVGMLRGRRHPDGEATLGVDDGIAD